MKTLYNIFAFNYSAQLSRKEFAAFSIVPLSIIIVASTHAFFTTLILPNILLILYIFSFASLYRLNHAGINKSISFIIIICIVLVAKRKIIGALAYTLIYGMYFGEHFFYEFIKLINGETLSIEMTSNLVCDLCAILLALFCLMDSIVLRVRNKDSKHKTTEWYFEKNEYDKELEKRDKRDDKNQYKFY